ncbi:hypothetical protein IJ768_01790 [Candidatus Saccharibacteria bacterium]|nr:hypothetical protein [Candidatus Saccharibacteria bacterium]
MTSKLKKIRDKKLAQEDLTAEEQILDDIFYDLYRNRGRVYKVNFFRGIFFGLGTFLGGTVVVAIVVFILTWISSHLPHNVTIIDWLLEVLKN